MREIRFRAKRIDTGEWVYGSYLYTFCEDKNCPIVGVQVEKHWIVEENGNMFWIDEDTICQYTGRVDKNGQKIWENDIVRHEDLSNGRYIARKQPMKNSLIKWNHIDAKFERDGGRDLYKSESRLEVIGNIFDNAELLERKESENE